MSQTVACSSFVKRQTLESGFSHFSGTWKELELLVSSMMSNPDNIKSGYKDGVILINVPAEINTSFGKFCFYSAIVDLTPSTKLIANYAPRLIREDSYIRVAAKATKQKAKYVEIVCYRYDILDEDNNRSTDADWEIIAIKARTSEEEEPMHYYTMARNHLHMPGGTQANFSAEDFAKSIIYWNTHAMCTKQYSWYKKIYNFFLSLLNK